MAKTAIQIIKEGYAYAGISPTGTPLNADMSREGLGFLNELLYKWNIENYFPFTNNTYFLNQLDKKTDKVIGAAVSD